MIERQNIKMFMCKIKKNMFSIEKSSKEAFKFEFWYPGKHICAS